MITMNVKIHSCPMLYLLRRLRYFALLMSFFSSLASCRLPAKPLPANQQPLVIGHAGSGFMTPLMPFNPLPANSMASIKLALAHGADGVEVDLQLSQDSVVMLYHDQTLESNTNGQGCVYELPAAAVQQLKYKGGWFYDLWHNERSVTLQTLLDTLSKRPSLPHLHFDLHETNSCNVEQPLGRASALARALGRLLAQYPWPPERLLVITMNQSSLAALRRAMPTIPVGLEITEDFGKQFVVAKSEKVQAIVVSRNLITPERTVQARAAGLQIITFGGRSKGTIQRLLESQPDAIQVDNVPNMLTLLDRPVQKQSYYRARKR